MKDRPKTDELLKQALEKYADAVPGDPNYENGSFIKSWSDWLLVTSCVTVSQKIVAMSGYQDGEPIETAIERVTKVLEDLGANFNESVCEDIALFGTGAIVGYTYIVDNEKNKQWEQLEDPTEIDIDLALNTTQAMGRCIRMGAIFDIRMKNVSKDLPFVELPEIAKNLILHQTKSRVNGHVVGTTATALEEAVMDSIIGG